MYYRMPGLSLQVLSVFPIIIQMSNLGKRQLSPVEKAFKYEFTLEILKYRCQVAVPCTLKFMWKRNSKSIETKNEIPVSPGSLVDLQVNEKLSSISTIIYNTDRKEFLPKESELSVNMFITNSPKRFAYCHIDMRNILDPNNHRSSRSEVFDVHLTLYPNVGIIKENRIVYRLSSIYKEEIVFSEKSIGNGSLNMSGLSIPQDGKYFQKRYEVVPSKDSKDTHSVASYNPNRYPSAKRERDDSSIRKFDHTYLAGLKSNLANTNDLDGKSAKKSVDNKTEMNEPYLGRQLAQEQQRRSKAEAELGKNKVEIDQLKKRLNQLVIENIKAKEELKKVMAENSSKDEINTFQRKLYDINNELRVTRNQLDSSNMQLQSIKMEKASLESELHKEQKRIDELQMNEVNPRMLQNLQGENAELKYQVDNLRRFIDQLKKQTQERESQLLSEKYREVHEANLKVESMRKEYENKLRSAMSNMDLYQKKLYDMQEDLKGKLNELTARTRQITELQGELEEYKNRLMQYQAEKSFMQREIIRLKQEGSDRRDGVRQQYDQRMDNLQGECSRLKQQLALAVRAVEEKQRGIIALQQEKVANQGKSSRLLIQANDVQKRANDLEGENRALKEKITKLEQQLRDVTECDSRQQMKASTSMSMSMSPEMDRMYRESLNMEVELKFMKDELDRMRGLEERLMSAQWQVGQKQRERQELQSQNQLLQGQLKTKTKSLAIEIERSKYLNDQLAEFQINYDLLREELDMSRNIIHNGQQQLKEMEQQIYELEASRRPLITENEQLRLQKSRLLASGEELRQLQGKVRELEDRNAEKLASLQLSNKNLVAAHAQIREGQKLAEERHQLLSLKEKQICQLEARLREQVQSRAGSQARLGEVLQEKKALEKFKAVSMEEMHSMKKRFQEEKGRSLTITRNEEFYKVRGLESELEKREKQISKLGKEKLEIEQENVRMNVQIMKLLSELEKYKAASGHSSLKSIPK